MISYDIYASSALAGQSLVRNVIGGFFPLFTTKLLETFGYSWANSLFGFIAVAMIPIPFVSAFNGFLDLRLTTSRHCSSWVLRSGLEVPAASKTASL